MSICGHSISAIDHVLIDRAMQKNMSAKTNLKAQVVLCTDFIHAMHKKFEEQ